MKAALSDSIQRDVYLTGKEAVRTIVHEFLVDLLGVVLPGVMFVALFWFWTYAFVVVATSMFTGSTNWLQALVFGSPLSITGVSAAFFFAVAYVTGHFFYRRPLQEPDFRSALRIWRKHMRLTEERAGTEQYPYPVILQCFVTPERTCVHPSAGGLFCWMFRWMRCSHRISNNTCPAGMHTLSLSGPTAVEKHARNAGIKLDCLLCVHRWGLLLSPLNWAKCTWKIWSGKCNARERVKFPYDDLKGYLCQRGLKHLADLVPWQGPGDTEGNKKRTKIFLNILKIRLEAALPGWCQVLTRNEAHIRLMSSTWFMAGTLSWLFCFYFIGAALLLLLVTFKHLAVTNVESVYALWTLTGGLAFFLVALLWARHTIQEFLLYQRIREVTQVLETAFYASVTHPELHILSGIYEQGLPQCVVEAREEGEFATSHSGNGRTSRNQPKGDTALPTTNQPRKANKKAMARDNTGRGAETSTRA